MTVERRRAQVRSGRLAETLAVWWLRGKGYRILARDWRSPVGEIDILARRGRLLVAVEVKRRSGAREAAEAVQRQQQRRIVRAAEAFLARLDPGAGLSLRFDVVLIVPGRWPRHIVDAWRPD